MTKILHTDAFTQRNAYTQGCFYTRVLLHRDAFHKDMLLHRDAFHKDMLLHTNVYAYRCFYAEMLFRAATFTHWCFTQGRFYREELLHIDAQVLLHTDAFKQQCFYTHALLRRKSFDTEYPLHREAFTQILLCGGVFTHKYMYTEVFFTHR